MRIYCTIIVLLSIGFLSEYIFRKTSISSNQAFYVKDLSRVEGKWDRLNSTKAIPKGNYELNTTVELKTFHWPFELRLKTDACLKELYVNHIKFELGKNYNCSHMNHNKFMIDNKYITKISQEKKSISLKFVLDSSLSQSRFSVDVYQSKQYEMILRLIQLVVTLGVCVCIILRIKKSE